MIAGGHVTLTKPDRKDRPNRSRDMDPVSPRLRHTLERLKSRDVTWLDARFLIKVRVTSTTTAMLTYSLCTLDIGNGKWYYTVSITWPRGNLGHDVTPRPTGVRVGRLLEPSPRRGKSAVSRHRQLNAPSQ